MNSQIILADVKLTNSEKQVRDGGRRKEERCIELLTMIKHKLEVLKKKQESYKKNHKTVEKKKELYEK